MAAITQTHPAGCVCQYGLGAIQVCLVTDLMCPSYSNELSSVAKPILGSKYCKKITVSGLNFISLFWFYSYSED